ncbi:hypothetical protein K1T71_011677 [Dendrolimus kikuchii]|uniref:Uncharacterized protein n=1 Tax=Dendrolimus kikuchii TaxID=765133 RepID=A0ACC1CLS4_9NEOP|nr:hypothetical protein K1T71_011677 [Dendrolimus kikuchii]
MRRDFRNMLNFPQLNWNFIDDPNMIYDLKEEDASETAFTHEEYTVSTPVRQILSTTRPPVELSPLDLSPKTPTTSRPSASALIAPNVSNKSPQRLESEPEPALPQTSACSEFELMPIGFSSPAKRSRSLFDGHSPLFCKQMYRDAQINIHAAELNISPHPKMPFNSRSSEDDIYICSIVIEDVQISNLNGWKSNVL